MAVKAGMKRLEEFDYLTELSDEARAALDIPEDAEVLNITDHFREGGAIVVSYTRKRSETELEKNRQKLQSTIDSVFDDIEERCNRDPEYFAALKKKLGITD